EVICIPLSIISSLIIPWNINPNPNGIVIYGNFNAKVKAVATARRSICNLLNKPNNGGIRIGINAICKGTKFCENIPNPGIDKTKIILLFINNFNILLTKNVVKLEEHTSEIQSRF